MNLNREVFVTDEMGYVELPHPFPQDKSIVLAKYQNFEMLVAEFVEYPMDDVRGVKGVWHEAYIQFVTSALKSPDVQDKPLFRWADLFQRIGGFVDQHIGSVDTIEDLRLGFRNVQRFDFNDDHVTFRMDQFVGVKCWNFSIITDYRPLAERLITGKMLEELFREECLRMDREGIDH